MTYEEIAWMAWEMLGEPTDLDPTTNPVNANLPWATNEGRWIDMINRGQDAIAMFKSGHGRMFRYKNDSTLAAFETSTATKVVNLLGSKGVRSIQFPSTGEGDDFYKGWVVTEDVNQPQYGYQVLHSQDDTTNVTLYLDRPLQTAFNVGDSIKLMDRSIDLRGLMLSGEFQNERVLEVLDAKVVVFDPANTVESAVMQLEPLPREGLNRMFDYFGYPGYWYRQGNRLFLDRVNPAEDTYVYTDIKRLPTERSLFSEEPELPEQFHYAILLWVVAWGHARYSDIESRKDYRGQLREFMETTMTDYMVEFERNDQIGGKVRMK